MGRISAFLQAPACAIVLVCSVASRRMSTGLPMPLAAAAKITLIRESDNI